MVDVRKNGILLALFLALTLGAQAQFIGYISSQSTAQVVFTAQAANATSSILSNIGQSSHYLTVCNSALVATITLEASTDGTFGSPVTLVSGNYQAAADSSCHVLQAGGYYPAVRARVKNYSSGSTNVFYTGIGGPTAPAPSALSTIGPAAPVACDLTSGPSSVAASTSNASLITGITSTSMIVCSLTLSFSAATTAGQVQLTQGAAGSCAAPTALYTLNITANTPQIVHLIGASGGLFRLPPGSSLCITTGALTAATLVATEFAQISF
jgi:hypothetical protein